MGEMEFLLDLREECVVMHDLGEKSPRDFRDLKRFPFLDKSIPVR
jgi:hypothetical protein